MQKLPEILNDKALIQEIDRTALYVDLVKQLHKDFDVIGTAVDFSVTKNPNELFIFLQEVITELLQKHFDVFLNLLYRIDVDENQIKSIIDSMSDNIEREITFLILKREWKKVWFKKNYS